MVFASMDKMNPPLDEADLEVKTPMKRIGSTRKLLVFNNIRLQLNDQLRCLDARVDAQAALAAELQDYFRRRADVEADYSRGLDKLAKTLQLRHKEQKHKREQWPLFSSYTCWQQLVGATKALARDHAALAELYGTRLVARLQSVAEDVQRVYKRCREIGYETHEEILRVLGELQTAMKTHQQYAAGWRAASTKLRAAQAQRARTIPAKKLKLIDKEIEKRRLKHADAKLKALKARSEYLLCLEAANTTIHKYFVDDLSDLIDCMDLGFHNCISRALRMQASADEGRARALQQSADTLYACIDALDSRVDKQKFLEAHHQAFMIPRKLSYQGQQPEEEDLENATDDPPPAEEENGATAAADKEKESDSADVALRAEMEARLSQLEARIRALRAESGEACKTLETAESTLLSMVDADDWETSHLFGETHSLTMYSLGGSSPHDGSTPGSGNSVNKPPEQVAIKARADRHETEEFYLSKFREYLLGSGRIARLEAKAALLRGKVGCSSPSYSSSMAPGTPTPLIPRHRRRICAPGRGGRIGLFAASLDEHLELTRRELPLVLTSCIRVINLYGLQHQGIFRVSGSQVEITALREWFERGEDPLAAVSDASDINSVAGLLKLYLRELRPPLIPIIYFDHLIELSQLDSKPEFVTKMSEFVSGLPRPAMVLLRYLFAFLNHLSEFSEENMMDPWNLAICFGPTLVPVPEDKDQVQYQNQVNDLIKNIIIFHEEIFVRDGGPIYEKYQTLQGQDSEECPQETTHDDVDSENSLYPSEDEQPQTPQTPGSTLCPLSAEIVAPGSIAVAAWSWKARAPAEISVRAGDHLKILARRHSASSVGSAHSSNQSGVCSNNGNTNWYLVRCLVTGREGLVPEGCVTTNTKSNRDDDYGSRHSPSLMEDLQAPLTSHRSSSSEHLLEQTQAPPPNNTWPRHNSERGNLSGDESMNAGNTDDESCDVADSEIQRRKHSKSQSVGNTGTVPFSLNREIWQQRASSQLKHTPDLVMDLPAKPEADTLSLPAECAPPVVTAASGTAVTGTGGASPTTGAERFAQNQHNTLKKKPTAHDRDSGEREMTPPSADDRSETPSTPPMSVKNAAEHLSTTPGDATLQKSIETSPVPPRNTKRVAAKFADLTLTGGSLKPQVAAKPAVLLRRQPPVGAIGGKPINPPVVPTSMDGSSQ